MPTRYAQQPQWRQRRTAIEKKGFIEAEMLMESEIHMPVKPVASTPSSPMSIASVFDLEIKPMVLPGAWTIVGKGGKPVKPEHKMYDPPKSAKKKKKRTRAPKVALDEDVRLEVLASSSTSCAERLKTFSAHDEKATRGRDTKHWRRYRADKKMEMYTRDALIEALEDDGALAETRAAEVATAQMLKMMRSNKADSNSDKARRRKARQAARDARCYSLATPDEDVLLAPSTRPRAQKKMMALETTARTRGATPATSKTSDTGSKRKGDEAAAAAARPRDLDKQQRKASGKATNCVLM